MSKNIISVNMENLSKEEKEQLLFLVEKANNFKNLRKPEYGETYFFIDNCSSVACATWSDGLVDNSRYDIGNCYHTQASAEFAIEKLKTEMQIRRYIAEHDVDAINWNNENQPKCRLYYDISTKLILMSTDYAHKNCEDFYFSKAFDYETMIQSIGEARIKKYIFRVE